MIDTRPLVLLDVDGVLHDRSARDRIRMAEDPEAMAASLGVIWVAAGGVKVAIPESVAEIVRRLVQVADVWWCTTWGERANTHLAPALGIEPLPVVGAGTRGVGIELEDRPSGSADRRGDLARATDRVDRGLRRCLPRAGRVEFVDTAARASSVRRTTWGERANTHLAPAIGIEPLPVVGAGTRGVGIEWKVAQAGPLIDEATLHGRRVVWIEDFDGAFPEVAAVEFVDTAATGLISEKDLPPGLLP